MRERPSGALIRSGHRSATALDGAPPDDTTLDDLARAATDGDPAAVERVCDALLAPVSRYISVRVRSREDAEDLTQLVFERIVGALPRYRHNGRPFAAWAFRIARNAVIDHQRRLRPTEQLGSIAEPSDDIGPDALSVRGEEIRELRAAIQRLTR